MQIQKVTVQALFSRAHYVVPSFQRRYVWGKDRQWGPLWQDVTDKAAEALEHGKGDDVLPHFLGALVLKQQNTGLGQPMKRMVVDGQQRLTTLQVMIIAIRDAFRCVSRETDEELREQIRNTERALEPMIVSPPPVEKDNRYMIRPFATRDFEVFKQLVAGEEVAPDHVLKKCHDYFRSEAVKWLRADPDLVADRARTLAEVLVGRFEVVGLNLDPKEDEYEIFEALNARGTPLTEWEKSKNHALSKSRQTRMGHEDFYDKYVRQFDENEWWHHTISAPRFHGSHVELLLNYWLTIKLCRGIQANRAYYDFCQVVKNEGDLVQMAQEYLDYAGIYRQLTEQPMDHTIQGLFRYRLDVLRIAVVMPLMMELYRILGSTDRFGQCCRVIESYLVRRQVTQWTTKGYRDLFINLLKRVIRRTEGDGPLQVVFDGLVSAPYGWPSDDAVRHAVLSYRASPGVASSRLRMVLEAVEDHRISQSMAAYPHAPRRLWIEHIMPQKWQTHWPLPQDAPEEDHRKRDHALTTLGNLTLTTSALDISLTNSPWEKKRESLKTSDNLFLNKDLLDRFWDRWDEGTIEKRGMYLADIICKVWPSAEEFRAEFGGRIG